MAKGRNGNVIWAKWERAKWERAKWEDTEYSGHDGRCYLTLDSVT
jgi:hypothetical protein